MLVVVVVALLCGLFLQKAKAIASGGGVIKKQV